MIGEKALSWPPSSDRRAAISRMNYRNKKTAVQRFFYVLVFIFYDVMLIRKNYCPCFAFASRLFAS